MHGQEKQGIRFWTLFGMLVYASYASPVWSHGAEGSHRDRLEEIIAPNDNYELCLMLTQDQQLRYAFSAPRKLDFNIHYHADHEVFYPVSSDQVMDAKATFLAQSEQEYCLMWTNQGDTEVQLSLEYEKPQATSR